MCQCFIRISFSFDKARLYVTDNDIHCLSLRFFWVEQVAFNLTGQLSEFAVLQNSFLYPFSKNFSISFLG